MAPVQRQVVHLVRIDQTGWQRDEERREYNRLDARLSDGTTVSRIVFMNYRAGERERLVEVALNPNATPKEIIDADMRLKSITDKRARLVEQAYGELQKLYNPLRRSA